LLTLAGAFLALLSGIYVLYRERAERPVVEQIDSRAADWMEKANDEQDEAGLIEG
jgi:hypothetical protein